MADKVYLEYPRQRDVIFVMGAGASISEGVPLQKDIVSALFSKEDADLNGSEAINLVRQFIEENFYTSGGKFYPTLESIFGYLDYFITKQEALGQNYSTEKIREIREALIQSIHYLIASNCSKGEVYKKFWRTVDAHNRNISVVTMNYDTLIDEAFDFLFYQRAFIDFCIDLMNYNDLEGIDAFNWWINPREPVQVEGGELPVPIKLLKIHGSLNWKFCNCCNQVLLTPWDTRIDLTSMGFKRYIYPSCENPDTQVFDLLCPHDGNRFQTCIVPPSHIKNLAHPVINKLLDETASEIRKSRKLVFIGYSFPEADVHIKALFKKNLLPHHEIHVVDPYLNEQIKSNYRSLSEGVHFHEIGFDRFVDQEMGRILSAA